MTGPKLDIEHLSLDDLLGGLADRTSLPRKPQSMVAKWLEEADIYPGTTRVQSTELYDLYHKWAVLQPNSRALAPNVWGRHMTDRLKRGRSKHGIFYYISRQSGS